MNVTHFKNPFSLEPIRLRAQFFGRRREIQRALSFLNHGQCISIEGPARIGKTSLLFQIAHPHIRAKHKLAEEQIFVHLDGRSLVDPDLGRCYLRIREEAIRQIKNEVSVDKAIGVQLEKTVRETSRETAYFNLDALFRAAQRYDLKLIISLDNFDTLARNPHLEDAFFSALRSLHMKYEMAYLIASQSPLDELEQARPEPSPFFNIFQPIRLGPFTPEESRNLVVTLLKRAHAAFPKFVTDHILELGNDEPHRLQRAGYIAFQVWQENGGDLNVEHCGEISQRFEKWDV